MCSAVTFTLVLAMVLCWLIVESLVGGGSHPDRAWGSWCWSSRTHVYASWEGWLSLTQCFFWLWWQVYKGSSDWQSEVRQVCILLPLSKKLWLDCCYDVNEVSLFYPWRSHFFFLTWRSMPRANSWLWCQGKDFIHRFRQALNLIKFQKEKDVTS